jgi:hypothetical protein
VRQDRHQEVRRRRHQPSRLRGRAREAQRRMDLLLLLPTRHHIVVRRGAMVWVLFVNGNVRESRGRAPACGPRALDGYTSSCLDMDGHRGGASVGTRYYHTHLAWLGPCVFVCCLSCSALYSWLPNALLVVCWLYGLRPWRLLDSLAITTHTASISNQGIYIYIYIYREREREREREIYTLSQDISISKEDRPYH